MPILRDCLIFSSIAYLQLHQFEQAISLTSHIVDLERAHLSTKSNLRKDEDIYIVQAYMIRAQAREMVGQDRGALDDL